MCPVLTKNNCQGNAIVSRMVFFFYVRQVEDIQTLNVRRFFLMKPSEFVYNAQFQRVDP